MFRKSWSALFTFVLSSLAAQPLAARDKTDVVYFTNGDRIHCEIRRLDRGKLTVKSIGFGTIAIEWDKISHLESSHPFQVELASGIRYVGELQPGSEPRQLSVLSSAGDNRLENERIVWIQPLEKGFGNRMVGSVDVGYDFTSASTSTRWNLTADVTYTTERYQIRSVADSLIREQKGSKPVNRQDLSTSYLHNLEGRWFVGALGQLESNDNQSLEVRGLLGGGAGRRLLETNRTRIWALGGIALSNEKYSDTELMDSGELFGAFFLDTFRFTSPQLEVTTTAVVLPSLTDAGRLRLQLNARARMELVKDFFWSLRLFEIYDGDPPSVLAKRNDFGITSSLGWRF